MGLRGKRAGCLLLLLNFVDEVEGHVALQHTAFRAA